MISINRTLLENWLNLADIRILLLLRHHLFHYIPKTLLSKMEFLFAILSSLNCTTWVMRFMNSLRTIEGIMINDRRIKSYSANKVIYTIQESPNRWWAILSMQGNLLLLGLPPPALCKQSIYLYSLKIAMSYYLFIEFIRYRFINTSVSPPIHLRLLLSRGCSSSWTVQPAQFLCIPVSKHFPTTARASAQEPWKKVYIYRILNKVGFWSYSVWPSSIILLWGDDIIIHVQVRDQQSSSSKWTEGERDLLSRDLFSQQYLHCTVIDDDNE